MVLEKNGKKIKWSDRVTNVEVLRRVGEEKTILSVILRRKTNLIRHILKHERLIPEVIEGMINGTTGKGRKRIQHLDDLKSGKRYNVLKEEAQEKEYCRRRFIEQRRGPATWQNTL